MYVPKNSSFESYDLIAYLKHLKLNTSIHGILRYKQDLRFIAEITLKTGENLDDFIKVLFEEPMIIKGNVFTITKSRDMKNQVKNPLTKVYIYEAPFQLPSAWIRKKLATFGQLVPEDIFMHKYYNTDIYNGVRSITFTRIDTPIPTTLFVRGNRIKLRHENQDRRPVCGICKTKGHYRDECPMIDGRAQANYTDVDQSPPLPETGLDMRKEWLAKIEEQKQKARKIEEEKKKKAEEEKKRKEEEKRREEEERKQLEIHRKAQEQIRRDMTNRKRLSPNDNDDDDDFQQYRSKKNYKLDKRINKTIQINENHNENLHMNNDNNMEQDPTINNINNTSENIEINTQQEQENKMDEDNKSTDSTDSYTSTTSTISTIMSNITDNTEGYIKNGSEGDDELETASEKEESDKLCSSYPPCAQPQQTSVNQDAQNPTQISTQNDLNMSDIQRMNNFSPEEDWG